MLSNMSDEALFADAKNVILSGTPERKKIYNDWPMDGRTIIFTCQDRIRVQCNTWKYEFEPETEWRKEYSGVAWNTDFTAVSAKKIFQLANSQYKLLPLQHRKLIEKYGNFPYKRLVQIHHEATKSKLPTEYAKFAEMMKPYERFEIDLSMKAILAVYLEACCSI